MLWRVRDGAPKAPAPPRDGAPKVPLPAPPRERAPTSDSRRNRQAVVTSDNFVARHVSTTPELLAPVDSTWFSKPRGLGRYRDIVSYPHQPNPDGSDGTVPNVVTQAWIDEHFPMVKPVQEKMGLRVISTEEWRASGRRSMRGVSSGMLAMGDSSGKGRISFGTQYTGTHDLDSSGRQQLVPVAARVPRDGVWLVGEVRDPAPPVDGQPADNLTWFFVGVVHPEEPYHEAQHLSVWVMCEGSSNSSLVPGTDLETTCRVAIARDAAFPQGLAGVSLLPVARFTPDPEDPVYVTTFFLHANVRRILERDLRVSSMIRCRCCGSDLEEFARREMDPESRPDVASDISDVNLSPEGVCPITQFKSERYSVAIPKLKVWYAGSADRKWPPGWYFFAVKDESTLARPTPAGVADQRLAGTVLPGPKPKAPPFPVHGEVRPKPKVLPPKSRTGPPLPVPGAPVMPPAVPTPVPKLGRTDLPARPPEEMPRRPLPTPPPVPKPKPKPPAPPPDVDDARRSDEGIYATEYGINERAKRPAHRRYVNLEVEGPVEENEEDFHADAVFNAQRIERTGASFVPATEWPPEVVARMYNVQPFSSVQFEHSLREFRSDPGLRFVTEHVNPMRPEFWSRYAAFQLIDFETGACMGSQNGTCLPEFEPTPMDDHVYWPLGVPYVSAFGFGTYSNDFDCLHESLVQTWPCTYIFHGLALIGCRLRAGNAASPPPMECADLWLKAVAEVNHDLMARLRDDVLESTQLNMYAKTVLADFCELVGEYQGELYYLSESAWLLTMTFPPYWAGTNESRVPRGSVNPHGEAHPSWFLDGQDLAFGRALLLRYRDVFLGLLQDPWTSLCAESRRMECAPDPSAWTDVMAIAAYMCDCTFFMLEHNFGSRLVQTHLEKCFYGEGHSLLVVRRHVEVVETDARPPRKRPRQVTQRPAVVLTGTRRLQLLQMARAPANSDKANQVWTCINCMQSAIQKKGGHEYHDASGDNVTCRFVPATFWDRMIARAALRQPLIRWKAPHRPPLALIRLAVPSYSIVDNRSYVKWVFKNTTSPDNPAQAPPTFVDPYADPDAPVECWEYADDTRQAIVSIAAPRRLGDKFNNCRFCAGYCGSADAYAEPENKWDVATVDLQQHSYEKCLYRCSPHSTFYKRVQADGLLHMRGCEFARGSGKGPLCEWFVTHANAPSDDEGDGGDDADDDMGGGDDAGDPPDGDDGGGDGGGPGGPPRDPAPMPDRAARYPAEGRWRPRRRNRGGRVPEARTWDDMLADVNVGLAGHIAKGNAKRDAATVIHDVLDELPTNPVEDMAYVAAYADAQEDGYDSATSGDCASMLSAGSTNMMTALSIADARAAAIKAADDACATDDEPCLDVATAPPVVAPPLPMLPPAVSVAANTAADLTSLEEFEEGEDDFASFIVLVPDHPCDPYGWLRRTTTMYIGKDKMPVVLFPLASPCAPLLIPLPRPDPSVRPESDGGPAMSRETKDRLLLRQPFAPRPYGSRTYAMKEGLVWSGKNDLGSAIYRELGWTVVSTVPVVVPETPAAQLEYPWQLPAGQDPPWWTYIPDPSGYITHWTPTQYAQCQRNYKLAVDYFERFGNEDEGAWHEAYRNRDWPSADRLMGKFQRGMEQPFPPPGPQTLTPSQPTPPPWHAAAAQWQAPAPGPGLLSQQPRPVPAWTQYEPQWEPQPTPPPWQHAYRAVTANDEYRDYGKSYPVQPQQSSYPPEYYQRQPRSSWSGRWSGWD